MDFDLSADQQALRAAAESLLERHCSRENLRAWVGDGVVVGTLPGSGERQAAAPGNADAPQGYDKTLWAAMAEQGWLAVELPEHRGGLGLGMVETAVLSEQVGRHVAPAPFVQSVLALGALARSEGASGNGAGSDQLSDWVDRLAGGDAVGTVAWSTRPGSITVEGSGSGVVLSGRPDPVVYGPSADVVVVVTDVGPFAVVIDEGNRPMAESAMDRTRELGWLHLDRTAAIPLGDATDAERLTNRAAAAVSAELLGIADRVLEMSVSYARNRVQFGKPIGSFQAIKHRLADSLVDVEGMRSTALYAAWCVSVDSPDASVAASMAKAWCTDASRRVLAAGLQVHGGIGFTWEHELHLYLKRSQLDEVSFGDASWHRNRLAGLLWYRLAAGLDLF